MTEKQKLLAVIPPADGQPGVTTAFDRAFQSAVTAGVVDAENWLASSRKPPIRETLEERLSNVPMSAREPLAVGFYSRIEQRLARICDFSRRAQEQIEAERAECLERFRAQLIWRLEAMEFGYGQLNKTCFLMILGQLELAKNLGWISKEEHDAFKEQARDTDIRSRRRKGKSGEPEALDACTCPMHGMDPQPLLALGNEHALRLHEALALTLGLFRSGDLKTTCLEGEQHLRALEALLKSVMLLSPAHDASPSSSLGRGIGHD